MSIPLKTQLATKQGVSKENNDKTGATPCLASVSPDAASIENEQQPACLYWSTGGNEKKTQSRKHRGPQPLADHQQRIGELDR